MLSVTVYENLQRPEEGITSPLLELQTVGCHPLEEQQMLFNPEPSLQVQNSILNCQNWPAM